MFILLITTKGEKLVVNSSHVEAFAESRKGFIVSLDDGSVFECLGGMSEVLKDFLQKNEKHEKNVENV